MCVFNPGLQLQIRTTVLLAASDCVTDAIDPTLDFNVLAQFSAT